MIISNLFIELCKRDLPDWPTLIIGLDKGWVTKSEISDYALKLLSEGQEDTDISLLAGSESLTDDEVNVLLITLCKKEGADIAMEQTDTLEKWRLASLAALQRSSLPVQDKLERLQELYAEFGYPGDMASCSIYAQDNIDPLEALQGVVSSLEQRFAKGSH